MSVEPKAEVAPTSMVSMVSWGAQDAPAILVPERHSARITGVPFSRLPVRLTLVGVRIV